MQTQPTLLAALAAIAAGRDHIRTAEFAKAVNREPQTCRKNYCLTGTCFGVRPIKVGAFLLWPVAATAAVLNGLGAGTQLQRGSDGEDSLRPPQPASLPSSRRRVRPPNGRASNPRRTVA